MYLMDRGSLFIQTLGTVKHAQGHGPFAKDPHKFKRLCMEHEGIRAGRGKANNGWSEESNKASRLPPS